MFSLPLALLQSVFIFIICFCFSSSVSLLSPKRRRENIETFFSFFCNPFLVKKNQKCFFSLYLKLKTFSLEKKCPLFSDIICFHSFLLQLIFEKKNVFSLPFSTTSFFSLLTNLFSSCTFFSSCFSPQVCLHL